MIRIHESRTIIIVRRRMILSSYILVVILLLSMNIVSLLVNAIRIPLSSSLSLSTTTKSTFLSNPRRFLQSHQIGRLIQLSSSSSSLSSVLTPPTATITIIPRGGAATAKDYKDDDDDDKDDDDDDDDNETGSTRVVQLTKDEIQQQKQYILQQQLLVSSRSMQLRQALISRGIQELQHTTSNPTGEGTNKQPTVVDWECSISTKQYPKSCLYTFDAEIGSKVIAPLIVVLPTIGDDDSQSQPNGKPNYQWITLSALNRLRRNDRTKVEPLWHNQYLILSTWFNRQGHFYSLYQHLTPLGTIISYLLDEPKILGSIIVFGLVLTILITLPVWEGIIYLLLTNSRTWLYWPNWSRFVHAALPLQLALAQMFLKFIQNGFLSIYNTIRNYLVEYECSIYEQSIPITYYEGNNKIVSTRSNTETTTNSDDADTILGDDDDDDDEDDDDHDNDDDDE